jgi:hypothetical protein
VPRVVTTFGQERRQRLGERLVDLERAAPSQPRQFNSPLAHRSDGSDPSSV